MHFAASRTPVRIIDFLIQRPARNEEVEGRLKGLLGLVKERVETVPAGCPQSAGGIHQACKGHRHHLIWRIHERMLIHRVRIGIVEILVITDTTAETPDAAQIGLHVRAPLSLWP